MQAGMKLCSSCTRPPGVCQHTRPRQCTKIDLFDACTQVSCSVAKGRMVHAPHPPLPISLTQLTHLQHCRRRDAVRDVMHLSADLGSPSDVTSLQPASHFCSEARAPCSAAASLSHACTASAAVCLFPMQQGQSVPERGQRTAGCTGRLLQSEHAGQPVTCLGRSRAAFDAKLIAHRSFTLNASSGLTIVSVCCQYTCASSSCTRCADSGEEAGV